MDGEIVPVEGEPRIEGVTLIDGQPVPVIDGHALFARHRAPQRAAQPLSCSIPASSEWARTILGPLVEAAGYRLAKNAEEEVDVAIVLDEGPDSNFTAAHSVIRLRHEPEAKADADETIYRYDRDALLAALKQVRLGKTA
jgi:two-component system chemotaxis sensor kinase CheA